MLQNLGISMDPTPGVETPVTPGEPDVLDGGDGVEVLDGRASAPNVADRKEWIQ
jgi:hypothetical protein